MPKNANKRNCNLHSDCDLADEMIRAAGGRVIGYFNGQEDRVMNALHCWSEDCEKCFGK